jgi:bifunctional DNA-binding transcriptional regulator/antitoxin component of YhaV-PrlF toxin-antitoxin module
MKLVAALSNRKRLSASAAVRHQLGVSRKDEVTVIGKDNRSVRMKIYRIPLHASSIEAITKTRAIYMNKRVAEQIGIRQGDVVTAQREHFTPRSELPPPSTSGGTPARGGIGQRILAFLGRSPKSTTEIAQSTGLSGQQVRDALRNLEKKGAVARDESDGLRFAKA